MGRIMPACLLILGALLVASPPARAQTPDCPTDATVTDISLVENGVPIKLRPHGTQLGDTIRITGTRLDALAACAGSTPLILFLGGRGFATLQPVAEGADYLDFELGVRPPAPGDQPDPWKLILGQPLAGNGAFPISVGLLGKAAVHSDHKLLFDRVPRTWFLIWLAVFGALLGLFFYCLHRTAILRDPSRDPDNPDALGTYSLARTQAAWWFFFILASYLLIGLVTGDFFTSLNGTALTLLGIGAGTAVIGSAIDATGAPQDTTARQTSLPLKQQELANLENDMAGGFQTRRDDAETEIKRLEQLPAPTTDEVAALARKRAELIDLGAAIPAAPMKKAALESQIRKLAGRSEGFVRDIVSDANGASFSRFQMIAWTVVLTVVFLRGVYTELAMPTFDLTLLGLMGLSAATYLGMKTNEPAAPTPH